MDRIIESTLHTLQKCQILLKSLTDKQLCDSSIAPYNSSIGTHVRHVLDFYDCIFNSSEIIDLTARSRNKDVESKCCNAQDYLNYIIKKLTEFKIGDPSETILVIDDLGLGKIEMKYTLTAVLSQANSHTIHHYAIINYILEGLNISFEDSDFGYNPTTPKVINSN